MNNRDKNSIPVDKYYFLANESEMSRAVRNVDWSAHILGSPENWSISLRNTLGMVLESKFPMLFWWGGEMIQFCNDACLPILSGIGKIPGIGKRAEEVWSHTWHLTGPIIQKVMQSRKALYFEDEQLGVDMSGKENHFYSFSYSPVFGDSGEVAGVLGVCTDTSERVISKKRIEQSDKRFEILIEQAAIGIIVLDGTDAVVSIVNKACLNLVGCSYDTLIHKPLFEVLPESEPFFKSIIDKVRTSGEPYYLNEYPYYKVDDAGGSEPAFLNLVYQAHQAPGSTNAGVMVLCSEVSDLVVSQRKLKHSEQQVRALVAAAPFPIGVYQGAEMRITMANQAIIDLWDKGNDIVGKTYFEVLPELENQDIYPKLLAVFQEGRPYDACNQRVDLKVHGQLRTFYFNYSFTPLFDHSGRVYGVLNTAADVTDLNLAKIYVEQTQQNFRNLILQAPVCMCLLLGPSHVVEVANEFMINLWGKNESEVMNKPIFDALPDARQQGLEELLDHVFKTGETYTANEMPVHLIRFGIPDVVYQNFIYEPYRDGSGQILGVIAISNNVTQQVLALRRIEEIVNLRTEELESANENLRRSNSELAQFAYIASHDLQEPLRKISVFSQMLDERAGPSLDEKSRGQLRKITDSSRRMQALVRDVLAYSQLSNDEWDFVSVDLNEIVQAILSDMELLIEQKSAHVSLGELPIVPGHPLQLTQLLSNLIGNSLKFHRPDAPPVLTIEAFQVSDKDNEVLGLNPDINYVNIMVSDQGVGFNEEQAEKIFGLFQRLHTKSEFEGTGIGLSICAKIVENHKGLINARGSSHKGAKFNIYLPLR